MRRIPLRIVVPALLAAGAILAAVLVFSPSRDPRYELPPCFEIGAPFHHRYRPGCAGRLWTPRGEVELTTNEHGLRERALAEVLQHPSRVLVIGDSFVEGWWAAPAETISAELTRRFPRHYFVNAGLRSTGPLFQAELLPGLLRAYRPKAVLWFLNDTDAADDRLACAVAEDPTAPPGTRRFGVQEFELHGWRATVASAFGGTAPARALRRSSYQGRWKELVHGEAAARCGKCQGIEELAGAARRAGVPVLAVLTHADLSQFSGHYRGEKPARVELAACLGASGVRVLPASTESLSAEERGRYLWPEDFHLNPEGTVWLAGALAPELGPWLQAL